ncbi:MULTISPECIES: DNA repair protein [unclassified Bradyrhizobium]|uniref:ImuA family protein n=1 Tax=unclassified Bradyrhizobium TaxID=2631580 RepID=UPI0028E31916|nr:MULTISPECIES: DNA repair protein [unclassified Bradyrhizobium]
MTGARMDTLARLRSGIARLEAGEGTLEGRRVALGHDEVDATLQGGLATGALHEVFAPSGTQAAAATGFVFGLAARVSARRPLIWIRQDFAERESGALSPCGLAELGLDPRLLVTVRAPDLETALRTGADALACDALGAVMIEVWGETKKLDLVASRKLTLAAQASGVAGLMLRIAAEPVPSTAETRWMVRTAPSLPGASWTAWGAPRFDAELVRNRHGQTGRWIMEWTCDDQCFSQPAADTQPVAAAPADRSHQAKAGIHKRHA